jgi:hypothetical protein
MLRSASSANRRLPAALAALALAVGLTGWLATASAHAAPKPPYTVALASTSTVAGSKDNSLVFGFTARKSTNTAVSVRVPTGDGWTAPQNRDAALPGYVSAARGTCKSAAVTAVRAARTITVSTKCKKGNSFTLTYAGAEAPTVAGPYTFTTRAVASGSNRVLSPQPVVTVNPGATSQLAVTGLADAVAGVAQDMTATAQDEFGNTTPDYRGTVRFRGSGPPAAWVQDEPLFSEFNRFNGFLTLPGDYAFTAADGGVHTFTGGVKIIFAGDQTVTATDTEGATITGSQTVTIKPGPTAGYDVLEPVFGTHRVSIIGSEIPKQRVTVAAFDQWGNIATSDNGTINFTWEGSNPAGGTPGDLPSTLRLANGTASYDVTWPTMSNGNVRVVMRGSSAYPGTVPGTPTGFTRVVEIDLHRPAANAEVITILPTTPGADPTYGLKIALPDQNLVITGPLTVTNMERVELSGAQVVVQVSGVTTSGIPISTSLALDLVTNTGNPILQKDSQLKIIGCGDPMLSSYCASSEFAPVQVTSGNPVTFSTSGLDGRNQLMVATAVASTQCRARQVWLFECM